MASNRRRQHRKNVPEGRRPSRNRRPSGESRQQRLRREREETRKITKIRRHPLNRMNPGVLVFGFIFVYIIIVLALTGRNKPITGYEVKLGSLAVKSTARGVAVRTELVSPVKADGYINYYARENERVEAGALVYSVDETGTLSEMINEGQAAETDLSEEDLIQLRSEIINYQKSFTDYSFRSVYGFKDTLMGTVAKLANASMLSMMQSVSGNRVMSNSLSMGYSDESGIVIYSTDGLEDLTPSSVDHSVFLEDNHQKVVHPENTIVSAGENAYKLLTDENWSIIVPWDESWEEDLRDGDYVNVRFLKNGLTSWGKMTRLHNSDGEYLALTFTNSMITFAADRYIDIELLMDEKNGLKIPNSSLVEREFYVIPRDYLTRGGDSDKTGFLRQAYLENGKLSTDFVEAKVYDETEEGVYIDTAVFEPGDTILMPDGAGSYTVSTRDKLSGVYNMNNGYADFTKVRVLYSNKEYSIVESGTNYGLSVYDHIVLEGDGVQDDDFIYDQGM